MLKEFKEFALHGSVIDLAVGVIIGGAFGKIVTSLVNDIIMPPIGMLPICLSIFRVRGMPPWQTPRPRAPQRSIMVFF